MRLTLGNKIFFAFVCIIAIDAAALFMVRTPGGVFTVSALSVIIGLVFARAIAAPFRRLTKSVTGDPAGTIDPGAYPIGEARDLAAALREAAGRGNLPPSLPEAGQLDLIYDTIGSVRHDINNPLMIISGNAQVLEMMTQDSPDDLKEHVRTILRETGRIETILKRLRDLKKPSAADGSGAL